MTLVIAEVSDKDAFVIGDSLLSFVFCPPGSPQGSVNGMYHALKIHILDPKCCVAVAGEFDLGLKVIKSFKGKLADLKSKEPENLSEVLMDSYRIVTSDVSACDFLLLVLDPSGNKLLKLSDGNAEICSRGYIGDPDAYRELQRRRKPYNLPDSEYIQQPDGRFLAVKITLGSLDSNFIEQSIAMEAIGSSRSTLTVGSIGDNIVRVRVGRMSGRLEYMQQVQVGISPEEGTSGACFLALNSPPYAVGIYYRLGFFGFLMTPGNGSYAEKINAPNLKAFLEKLKMERGISLEGGTWNE